MPPTVRLEEPAAAATAPRVAPLRPPRVLSPERLPPPEPGTVEGRGDDDGSRESLFERFAWLYAFFRERIFRDDTGGFAAALWPEGGPPPDRPLRVVELGCGPGFYSCRLARQFPSLQVVGVDRSRQQIRRAEETARRLQLTNCRFHCGDVCALSDWKTGSVDALLAVRLFTVVVTPAARARVLAEMHRLLRPGGRGMVAEPRSKLRASVPLRLMWGLAGLSALATGRAPGYREPREVSVLAPPEFQRLVFTQPWRTVWRWQDPQYQYAVGEKGSQPAPPPPAGPPETFDYAI